MREVFGEILQTNFFIIFELLPFFDILDIANAMKIFKISYDAF